MSELSLIGIKNKNMSSSSSRPDKEHVVFLKNAFEQERDTCVDVKRKIHIQAQLIQLDYIMDYCTFDDAGNLVK